MISRRVTIALAALLLTIGSFSVVGAEDQDPNILNWSPIDDPGPRPVPDRALLQTYGLDIAHPEATVWGMAQVHYKDGSALGCLYRNETVDFVPATPYTKWLLQTRTLAARASHNAEFYLNDSGVPEIGWNGASVVRRIACGQWNRPGYFAANDIPVGHYYVVAMIKRESRLVETENVIDYNPYLPGAVPYQSHDETRHADVTFDIYQLYSEVIVTRGGGSFEAPPFQVLYHWQVRK